jgi:hypothetical protein
MMGDNQGAGAPGADHMVQRKNTEKKVKPNPSHDALPLEIDYRYSFKCLVKEFQESSWVAKFIFGKVEDLDVGEVHEMYHELSGLHQMIQLVFPTRHHGGKQEVGGLRDPSLMQPAWWRPLPSQKPLPSAFPLTPMQLPTQLLPRLSRLAPTRSQSSIVNPMMLPPQQFSSPSSVNGRHPFIAQNYYDYIELPPTFVSHDSTPLPNPTNMPYHTSLCGLNIDLGKTRENGGEIDTGLQCFEFSGGPLQGDGWIDEVLL